MRCFWSGAMRDIMEERSVKVEPITVPEPAMVSRRGVIAVVAERARLWGKGLANVAGIELGKGRKRCGE